MGTICAPSYANIFMGKFESIHIYPHIRDKTITCLLYVDDFFFIKKGAVEDLISFIEELNKNHPSIKFNFKYSKTEIEFSDTKIYKDTSGKLCLTIYRNSRPINSNYRRPTKLLTFQISPSTIFEGKYYILPSISYFERL